MQTQKRGWVRLKSLTLGSLFDGIGGFPLAAQRCGIRTLWASEIEPNCISITKTHFPEIQHLGSITEIDGGKIPPVDIISFGSPCQDLSVAGTQKGLSGERSGLFREAIRIIYEMRAATNGVYPAIILWENVPGAFNSNHGKDFRTVLEKITKARISMPDSGKWARAGMVRISGVDIAWRQLDAQYWGIPQRRKRIFLVADFREQRAAEILFKCESLLGYSEQSAAERPQVAADTGKRAEISGWRNSEAVVDFGRAGDRIRINAKKSATITASDGGSAATGLYLTPEIVAPENIILDDGGGKFIDIYTNGICSTLRAQTKGHLPCVMGCYPINDGVINGKANGLGIGDDRDPAPTLTGRDRHAIAFFEGQQFGVYKESDIAGTITTKQNRRSDMPILLEYEEYRHGKYRKTDTAGTLRASGASCGPGSETLIVKVEQAKLFIRYILRKLTPLECERLQGFPDEWTRYSFTGEEIKDTPRYVALGNSLAVPCAERVFRGIIAVMEPHSG